MKKSVKKVTKPKKVETAPFPQRSWQEWFSEYCLSQLALKFYYKYGKWPIEIKLGTLEVKELRDGSAELKVELA